MKRVFLFFSFLFFNILLKGQGVSNQIEMATGMRSSGKIYVVVGVILIVFIGLFIYLVTIDKRISRLEKDK